MYTTKGVSNEETLHIKKPNVYVLAQGVYYFKSGEQRTTELDLITRALKRRAQNLQNYPACELSSKYNCRSPMVRREKGVQGSQGSFQTNAVHAQRNTVTCKKTSFGINQSFAVLPALHSVLF